MHTYLRWLWTSYEQLDDASAGQRRASSTAELHASSSINAMARTSVDAALAIYRAASTALPELRHHGLRQQLLVEQLVQERVHAFHVGAGADQAPRNLNVARGSRKNESTGMVTIHGLLCFEVHVGSLIQKPGHHPDVAS